MSRAHIAAVVVAGGSGRRFGATAGKQLAPAAGRPLVAWSLLALDAAEGVDRIVLVCHPQRVDEFRETALEPLRLATPVLIVGGGATRADSVAAGLDAVLDDSDIVLIHDGARPMLTPRMVADCVRALEETGADGVVIGHGSVDTLKIVEDGRVIETADRDHIWSVQTPQVFAAASLQRAHERARADGFSGTDDAALVEHAGGVVRVVEGPADNIKVTRPEDLAVVDALLRVRDGGEG